MCVCDVARMDALSMWFHRMAVMCIGYNSRKCGHMVDLDCSKMVAHFLEIVDHVVYAPHPEIVYGLYFLGDRAVGVHSRRNIKTNMAR
nr:hypothetical protein [Tanacetum cinerariifolium]